MFVDYTIIDERIKYITYINLYQKNIIKTYQTNYKNEPIFLIKFLNK